MSVVPFDEYGCRGCVGNGFACLRIHAVSISLAAAGLFSSPIFVVLISVLIFRERIGWRRLAGVVIGFIGVCLVLQIGTQPLQLMAAAPIMGGFMYALSLIWTRRYCRQEHAVTMAFWNLVLFFVVGAIGMFFVPLLKVGLAGVPGADFLVAPAVWPPGWVLFLLVSMGAAAALGMVLLAFGYTRLESTFAALFDYSFLFWAPLFAWVFRAEPLQVTTAIGMLLIMAAGALAISDIDKSTNHN